MYRQWHTMPECLPDDGSLFPTVFDAHRAGRYVVLPHRPQQIHPRWRERVGRFLSNQFLQRGRLRQGGSIFHDETAQRRAISLAAQSARHQRRMNVTAGLVPQAKRARPDVVGDAFS